MDAKGWGSWEKTDYKGAWGCFRVIEIFILTAVMAIKLNTCQNSSNCLPKRVNVTICKLYLNKHTQKKMDKGKIKPFSDKWKLKIHHQQICASRMIKKSSSGWRDTKWILEIFRKQWKALDIIKERREKERGRGRGRGKGRGRERIWIRNIYFFLPKF